jgi:2-amino-4-hydroxy-6-hydroxymethyldihydropteridine diphosphokinase
VRIISDAIEELGKLSADRIAVSSLWRTAPVDCPPGASNFVNAVVGLIPRVQESPESLLVRLQAIEKQFGRRPKRVLNEPRPLDLDLIAFGNLTRSSRTLILPHPRATSRRFVLQPLAEIAPGLVLPGQTKTVLQLLARLPLEKGIGKIQLARARRTI